MLNGSLHRCSFDVLVLIWGSSYLCYIALRLYINGLFHIETKKEEALVKRRWQKEEESSVQ